MSERLSQWEVLADVHKNMNMRVFGIRTHGQSELRRSNSNPNPNHKVTWMRIVTFAPSYFPLAAEHRTLRRCKAVVLHHIHRNGV